MRKAEKSYQLLATSGALAGGETSVITFNAYNLSVQNLGDQKFMITGFSINGYRTQGTVFTPLDFSFNITSNASNILNERDAWVNAAAEYNKQNFSAVLPASSDGFIKFNSAPINGSFTFTLTVRAINLPAIIAGDVIVTYVNIHFRYL